MTHTQSPATATTMRMPSCTLCALCKLEVLACHEACEIWRLWRNLKSCLIASYRVLLYHTSSKDTSPGALSRVTWNYGILLGCKNESEPSKCRNWPWMVLSQCTFGTLAGENPACCCLWQRLTGHVLLRVAPGESLWVSTWLQSVLP